MGFWQKEVIGFALDHETVKQMDEQRAWIRREPANARPYYHLAQLYRVAFKQDEALGLLLEAVRLDPNFADAHAALAEIYITRADDEAAWRHARIASELGDSSVLDLLNKYKEAETPLTAPPPPPAPEPPAAPESDPRQPSS